MGVESGQVVSVGCGAQLPTNACWPGCAEIVHSSRHQLTNARSCYLVREQVHEFDLPPFAFRDRATVWCWCCPQRPSKCVVVDYTRDVHVLGTRAGYAGALTMVSVKDHDKLK